MASSMVVNRDVSDPGAFKEFQERFPAVVKTSEGRYVTRGGKAECREGSWRSKRVVIFGFPSVDHARRLYESDDYAPLKAIRLRSTKSDVFIVEGV